MSAINDGGPAFPVPACVEQVDVHSIQHPPYPGMSLRDYFAAQALAGLVSIPEWAEAAQGIEECAIYVAHDAYALADAMLAARSAPR